MFLMIDITDLATLQMLIGFTIAYAYPAFALRQTLHAHILTRTRKRPRSDTATEHNNDDEDTVMTAERSTEDEPSGQGEGSDEPSGQGEGSAKRRKTSKNLNQ
jgi:hypothetical protein